MSVASGSTELANEVLELSLADTPEPELALKVKRGGGPKTPEGKRASSRNALNLGLRSKVFLPDDLVEQYEALRADLATRFRPDSIYGERLVQCLARSMVQLDRCSELWFKDLGRVINRAEEHWDSDQRELVNRLAARLPRDPERVAHRLGRTRQGVDWLIERWQGLEEALAVEGCWTDEQRSMAFDLLGVSPILRNGRHRVPAASDTAGLARLVADRLAHLREARDGRLDDLDALEQDLALIGMPSVEDAGTRAGSGSPRPGCARRCTRRTRSCSGCRPGDRPRNRTTRSHRCPPPPRRRRPIRRRSFRSNASRSRANRKPARRSSRERLCPTPRPSRRSCRRRPRRPFRHDRSRTGNARATGASDGPARRAWLVSNASGRSDARSVVRCGLARPKAAVP